MIADFFTKPLQGMAFIGFRNFIMNVDSDIDNDNIQNHRSVLNNIERLNPDDQVAVTTDGEGNSDGFIIVTRRQKKNKVGTIEEPKNILNGRVNNHVGILRGQVKNQNGGVRQGKRAKAHYI